MFSYCIPFLFKIKFIAYNIYFFCLFCLISGLKVKFDRQKHSTAVSSLRANGKTGQPQNTGTRAGGKVKDTLTSGDTGQKDSVVCLTSEQLQKILNTVQTTSNVQDPPQDQRTQNGRDGMTE